MKKALAKWKKITNNENISIPPNARKLACEVMVDARRWMVRECDRRDYLYWMPYKIASTDRIRACYINVNPTSESYLHRLVINISNSITIEQYDEGRLVSSVPAVIEKTPTVGKPSEVDKLKMLSFLGAMSDT